MNFLCWNVRGVGSGNKVGSVKKFVREQKVRFLGLVETKKKDCTDQFIRSMWGTDDVNWSSIDAIERSGGIICMWDKSLLTGVSVVKRERWMCVHGYAPDIRIEVAIITVYGYHDCANKRRMWEELIELKSSISATIMVMGDFNEIRHPYERKGCTSYSRSMEQFEEWVNDMGLVELQLIGRKFTWRRGLSCSKLDRVFIEPQWLQSVFGLKLVGLNCSLSDHVALLVKSDEVSWGPKPFRSIDAWFSHAGFLKLVEDEWKKCDGTEFMEKLTRLKQPLKNWNRDVFGNIDQNIKVLEREIDDVYRRLEEDDWDEVNQARLNALKNYVQIWYDRKCSFWRQLSREKAIKEMDRNSKFFHAVATVRSRRKNITQIRRGRRVFRAPRAIKAEVRNFYKSLYKQN